MMEGFPDTTETEGSHAAHAGWPDTPPPYTWDQAEEVAELVVEVMQVLIKATEDSAEAMELREDLKTIRTAQGVGIVLAGILHQFQHQGSEYVSNPGSGDDKMAMISKAYYFLEDF